jgi:DNA invertase Pin-like site-specific DNA recombinase
MFTIVSAIGELERNIIVERVRAGIRRVKEKGKILGRPKTLNLDFLELKKMRKSGMSYRQIAKQKNVSVRSVFKLLQKSAPAGR